MSDKIDSQNLQNENEERQIELTGKWTALYYILLVVTILALASLGAFIDIETFHSRNNIGCAIGFFLGIAFKGVIKLFVFKLSQKKNEK